MLDIFGACSLRCKFNIHFQDWCLSACEKQNIFALKYTNCTENSNDLNCTDTKHPLISVHFLDFTHILLTCTMFGTRDEPCWGRQDNSKSIQIHPTHIYHIIRYNMLNQTDQSWFMLWQLVRGITYCESVIIYHQKKLLGERLKVLQVCKEILHNQSLKYHTNIA